MLRQLQLHRNTAVWVAQLTQSHIHAVLRLGQPKDHKHPHQYGIDVVSSPKQKYYDAVVMAVAHQQFKKLSRADITNMAKDNFVLYDLKYVLNKQDVDIRL